MPDQPQIQPAAVAELIRIARDHNLSEVIYREGEARVELRLAPPGPAGVAGVPISEAPAAPLEHPADLIHIVSPMTGVFYGAPSPSDPPYVHPGDILREGDPIGLIEAMKVFSEVLADHSGRVRRITAANGQLVQQGEELVELTALDSMEL